MLKEKLNKLFWKFAEEKFVYDGNYPYHTALVFAFADYMENLSGEEISRLLNVSSAVGVRRAVRRGTDKWLRRHAKTMLIL